MVSVEVRGYSCPPALLLTQRLLVQENPDPTPVRNPHMELINGLTQELLGLRDPIWSLSTCESLRQPRPSPVPVTTWATPPIWGLSELQGTSDSKPPGPSKSDHLLFRLQFCSNCHAESRPGFYPSNKVGGII